MDVPDATVWRSIVQYCVRDGESFPASAPGRDASIVLPTCAAPFDHQRTATGPLLTETDAGVAGCPLEQPTTPTPDTAASTAAATARRVSVTSCPLPRRRGGSVLRQTSAGRMPAC